ncbi:MAG TPA: 50S ribosomal protein L30 [Myxococcota bacterium]|nr:50S ribosomal protein L30 [Myxococcota bacterium]
MATARKAKGAKAAATGKKLRVRQFRSAIGYSPDQHQTLRGLGLGKPNSVKELIDTAAIRGMIKKVCHLVQVESA